ncbi:hypothetical protein TWF703_002001 [Orbilia oligospora]|uniref:Uncharacterized protein n=1 Tax=Orbilia oligospora TaxID=2813651 RepID=A0A7C8NDN3_ORBOL|nr:hypothetical protein TWF703_002001 [Orbilia oligospora]
MEWASGLLPDDVNVGENLVSIGSNGDGGGDGDDDNDADHFQELSAEGLLLRRRHLKS